MWTFIHCLSPCTRKGIIFLIWTSTAQIFPLRNGIPLQYSCLENPMDRVAWWTRVHGVAKSQTLLSHWAQTHTHTYIYFNFFLKYVYNSVFFQFDIRESYSYYSGWIVVSLSFIECHCVNIQFFTLSLWINIE